MSDENDDKWEMPKPVFRSSAGSLPRSLEETISHSFMPNAETIEIDEDDDILSIMDTPYKGESVALSDHFDHEKTIEIVPAAVMETEANSNPEEVSGEVPQSEEPDHKPIVVTAKKSDETAAATASSSNLLTYILLILLVIGAVVGTFYVLSYTPPSR